MVVPGSRTRASRNWPRCQRGFPMTSGEIEKIFDDLSRAQKQLIASGKADWVNRFHIIQSPTLNAFVAAVEDGGKQTNHVVISTGLLERLLGSTSASSTATTNRSSAPIMRPRRRRCISTIARSRSTAGLTRSSAISSPRRYWVYSHRHGEGGALT